MSNSSQKTLILEGGLWKVAIKLSLPAIVAMVFYGLNSVFDAIFVGNYVGETALAGVSLAYPLSQLTLGLGSLIGVGAGSYLSIALGENNLEKQKRLFDNVNFLTILITLIYAVPALIFSRQLVAMMGGSGDELAEGVRYFRITVLGSLFWIHGLTLNMIIRAEGKMGKAAVLMGIGLLVNIAANFILIGVLGLGVAGAAWGTNIGMFVYSVQGILYFKGRKVSFEAHPFAIGRHRETIKSLISMGMPSLIMSVMQFVMAIVVFNALSRFGTVYDIAFYGAVYRIFTLMLTPLFGLMRAQQPMVGINFGAGQYERVIKCVKVFIYLGAIVVLPFWIFLMLAPRLTMGLMLPEAVLSPADILNYRIFLVLIPIMPSIFMSMTFFPAIDRGMPATVMGILRQVVLYIPIMLTLPRFFGVQWVYFGSAIIDSAIALYALTIISMEFKRLRRVEV